MDKGKVVICNVHNGGHWVLAHGYSGDNILVNDPGFSTTSYTLSQIVNGQNGVYRVAWFKNHQIIIPLKYLQEHFFKITIKGNYYIYHLYHIFDCYFKEYLVILIIIIIIADLLQQETYLLMSTSGECT